MKNVIASLIVLALLGCKSSAPSPAAAEDSGHVRLGGADIYKERPPIEGDQAPTWTNKPEDTIPIGCNQFMRCRAYTVMSYDDTWHNQDGNEGLFVLRLKNVKITAFCGGAPGSCYHFQEAVGQTIWLEDESTDLIYYREAREPTRDDPALIITKRQMIEESRP